MSVQSNQIREPEVNEAVQPTGDGARSERQDWRTLRKLDAEVAKRVMGIDVLGEVICVPNPEDWRLEIPIRARERETDRHKSQPVYLHECVCEHRYTEDSVHLGHIWLCLRIVSNYSTDIKAAMEVVARLNGDGYSFACTIYQGKLPYASFCKGTVATSRSAEASTLPEAICRAALSLVDAPKTRETQV